MDLEQKINEIKSRNKRVETDKAWEISKIKIGGRKEDTNDQSNSI